MRRASFVRKRRRLADKPKLREVCRVKYLRFCVLAAAILAVSCSQKKTAETKTEPKPDNAVAAAKPGWLTSYDQAQKEAQAKNKLLLMDFTGSDWCGWCIMLDKEDFSKPEFKDYASKNLVLFELGLPKTKKMPLEVTGNNYELCIKYGVQGLPTTVGCD